MAFKRLYFSKFSGGTCPRIPLGVLARSALVGRTDVRPPPPNFVTPYAYAFDLGLSLLRARDLLPLYDLKREFQLLFVKSNIWKLLCLHSRNCRVYLAILCSYVRNFSCLNECNDFLVLTCKCDM